MAQLLGDSTYFQEYNPKRGCDPLFRHGMMCDEDRFAVCKEMINATHEKQKTYGCLTQTVLDQYFCTKKSSLESCDPSTPSVHSEPLFIESQIESQDSEKPWSVKLIRDQSLSDQESQKIPHTI